MSIPRGLSLSSEHKLRKENLRALWPLFANVFPSQVSVIVYYVQYNILSLESVAWHASNVLSTVNAHSNLTCKTLANKSVLRVNIALASLLARRQILLNWKYSCPAANLSWLREVIFFSNIWKRIHTQLEILLIYFIKYGIQCFPLSRPYLLWRFILIFKNSNHFGWVVKRMSWLFT